MPSFLHLKKGDEARTSLMAVRYTWVLAVALTASTAMAQTASPDPLGALMQSSAASSPAAEAPSSPPVILSDEPSDPVSRFLNDNGLIDTRPVSALARQVKDKATNLASDLVISAMNFLGVRYKMGGQSEETGFDCSGFTRHVFERSVGLILPRRASEQAAMPGLMQVNQAELKPGDLVFFNTMRRTFSHVGIYVGDNKFIHSPRTGGVVRVEDMRMAYWQQHFDGARRAPALGKMPAMANNRADGSP
jgi:cell wall-associated NlpC family hydrolase